MLLACCLHAHPPHSLQPKAGGEHIVLVWNPGKLSWSYNYGNILSELYPLNQSPGFNQTDTDTSLEGFDFSAFGLVFKVTRVT